MSTGAKTLDDLYDMLSSQQEEIDNLKADQDKSAAEADETTDEDTSGIAKQILLSSRDCFAKYSAFYHPMVMVPIQTLRKGYLSTIYCEI